MSWLWPAVQLSPPLGEKMLSEPQLSGVVPRNIWPVFSRHSKKSLPPAESS